MMLGFKNFHGYSVEARVTYFTKGDFRKSDKRNWMEIHPEKNDLLVVVVYIFINKKTLVISYAYRNCRRIG